MVNARFVKPLDRDLIVGRARGKRLVVTLEESVADRRLRLRGAGGPGRRRRWADPELRAVPVKRIGLPSDRFVDHGSVTDLRRTIRLDVPGIVEQLRETLDELGLQPVPEVVPAAFGARTA